MVENGEGRGFSFYIENPVCYAGIIYLHLVSGDRC